MPRLTNEKLIGQIKELKEIKPRKEWAVLLKSQILAEKGAEPITAKQTIVKPAGILEVLEQVFLQRKLAYSLATIALLIIGIFGFAQYTMPGDLLFPVKKIAEQSQAALIGQTGLKQNVAVLNNRINDLAQVAKSGKTDNIPSAISEVSANASELAKNLKANPVKDLNELKEIAASLKTLASVPGTDLTATPEVEDLYQTVVKQQIDDLEKATLTEEQAEALDAIKELYEQGKYTDALEEILLINN